MASSRSSKGRINLRGKILICIFILLLGCLVGFFLKNKIFKVDDSSNKKIVDGLDLTKVKDNYSHFVKANGNIDIFDSNKEKIGLINPSSEFILDDNYEIKDEYYKLSGNDYYVNYKLVSKIDGLSEMGHNEYGTYNNYIVTNNIITNDSYSFYINDREYYSLSGNNKYDVVIVDDDKYGVIFNDRLVYINKSDVKEVLDVEIRDEVLKGLPVLNYHYTVNREAGELNECVSSICMEDTQVEEQIKYLFDNKYYAVTMRDVYLFLTGKIKLPKNSVAITIDDGWYLPRMINILEKYKMVGTLFLIGSLASPNDYKSDYLEIHSHSWNMHTPGICKGFHGGAILCWDKEKILEDLRMSRESLNNTTVYCFPFYEYNDKVIGYLKEAGFEMAFIGGDKKAYVGDDLFKIHRYELVSYTDMATFIKYVS